MQRWWQLATQSWRSRPGRTAAAVISVTIGVAVVVALASFQQSAFRAVVQEVVRQWLGGAHLTIYPPGAHWGTLDAGLAEDVARMEGVAEVTVRLRRRMYAVPAKEAGALLSRESSRIDAVGIDPETYAAFGALPDLEGRMLSPADRGVTIVERDLAEEWGVGIGDSVHIGEGPSDAPHSFEIIGLFGGQRLGDFQMPVLYFSLADLQGVRGQPGVASAIDVILADPSRDSIVRAREHVEQFLVERNLPYKVDSAEAQQDLIQQAQRVTRMVLSIFAFVALLTSFFIILTTMSMSLWERRSQLGVLRCVGMTRAQLAGMLLIELAPLGVVGTALGIGLGWGLIVLAGAVTDRVLPTLGLDPWGVRLASISGVLTTLCATGFLIVQVCRVEPLAAVNVESRPARRRWAYLAGLVGVALIVGDIATVLTLEKSKWLLPAYAFGWTAAVHVGYVLLGPALVASMGRPLMRGVGRLLGLPGSLAVDQLGRSPWRSAGVCWMLLVGLSLIVYAGIRTTSIMSLWDFPATLPEAFVWTTDYVGGDAIQKARAVPGVKTMTALVDVYGEIEPVTKQGQRRTHSLMDRFVLSLTSPVFVAGEPDEVLGILKLGFSQGTLEEARAKLKQGGHVLVPFQTAEFHDLHVGDEVDVTLEGRTARFTIAGVVQSPAFDSAVSFFQADSYMQFASASAIFGTRQDLIERFGLDWASLFLFNFDLPDVRRPTTFSYENLPDYSDTSAVAQAVLAWAEGLSSERAILARIRPELERWLASGAGAAGSGGAAPDDASPDAGGAAELSAEATAFLRRAARAVRYVLRYGDGRSDAENWQVFHEGLIMIHVAEEIDRLDAVIGSVSRLKQWIEQSIRTATQIITWIPSIALIVASIGIANLMTINVHARTRQIAVLRAVGASRSQVIRLVLTEAIVLALIGGIMGVALGVHESLAVEYVASTLWGYQTVYTVPYGTLAAAVGLTVLVCLAAGIAPARYAARSNVVAALQTT